MDNDERMGEHIVNTFQRCTLGLCALLHQSKVCVPANSQGEICINIMVYCGESLFKGGGQYWLFWHFVQKEKASRGKVPGF